MDSLGTSSLLAQLGASAASWIKVHKKDEKLHKRQQLLSAANGVMGKFQFNMSKCGLRWSVQARVCSVSVCLKIRVTEMQMHFTHSSLNSARVGVGGMESGSVTAEINCLTVEPRNFPH